jgi:hypothetical protein
MRPCSRSRTPHAHQIALYIDSGRCMGLGKAEGKSWSRLAAQSEDGAVAGSNCNDGAASSSMQFGRPEGIVRGSHEEIAQVQASSSSSGGAGGQAAGVAGSEKGGELTTRQALRQIFTFALPALGITLADPLMSLIDTATVGQVSAVQLAALGPNSIIFTFVFQASGPSSPPFFFA